jgi:hypothetical protein
MRNDQIENIKKVINILSTDVFPVLNGLDDQKINQSLIATMASIKLLDEVIENKLDINANTEESRSFAIENKEFLMSLMQKINNKNLNGTIIIKEREKDSTDAVMSTMREDELIESVSQLIINLGPKTFFKFIESITKKSNGGIQLLIGTGPPPFFSPDNEGDEE